MPDIIQLLPDSVANQIAAGEVIQRPASAVKELLENAIDAGATKIQLIVTDAGRTLIRVIDNGCGMSSTDARLSFERHATSKIRSAEELFQIRTKGFRGEALASIAAIAQVELKTRLHENELGTCICISGSEIESQKPCSTPAGTSFAIKNLFYNVPARRNFLKSEAVEMRHIIEEFQRVALAHPAVAFSLHHNNSEIYNLPAASLRQRIIHAFGAKYNERLVPVDEKTAIVSVSGFIGKPEFSRKTRGEQYFFVNDRFIKNSYLHHSVSSAFNQLIMTGSHPTYFLYLKVNPDMIDVNIHPTKTEVKFMEEKSIYAIVNSAVKRGLGKYNIAPSIDFETENSLNIAPLDEKVEVKPPQISVNPNFNPFETGGSRQSSVTATATKPSDWEDFYQITKAAPPTSQDLFARHRPTEANLTENDNRIVFQIHRKYILTQIKSGFVFIDQQKAHERILFEQLQQKLQSGQGSSQHQLYPHHLELPPQDYQTVIGMLPELARLGLMIDDFGSNSIVVNGVPSEAVGVPVEEMLEKFLEQYKLAAQDLKNHRNDRLARSMARSLCIKEGKLLLPAEMIDLIDRLFACRHPYTSVSGKPVVVTFSMEELDKKFKNT